MMTLVCKVMPPGQPGALPEPIILSSGDSLRIKVDYHGVVDTHWETTWTAKENIKIVFDYMEVKR